jgi:probable O-glycosylation ligase (exosortase A-associated)
MKGLLFTWVLTLIGGMGGVFIPFVGLCVYICFAIIRPEFMWMWNEDIHDAKYSKIVGISMLLGWLLNCCGRWEFRRGAPVVACLLGYWAWMIFSAVQAADQTRAWLQVEFYAKVFLPFLVGVTTIRTLRQVKILAWVILLSQGYVAFELNRLYYSGYSLFQEDGFGGMDNNCVAIAMVTGVGLAFFLGLSADRLWKKGVALGAAALMAHVILFSFSRGGMLALGLTGVMSFILIPKKPQHYIVFLLAILLGIRLAGPEVRERFMTTFEQSDSGQREASAESRLSLWSGALNKAAENPLFGVGPDNWGQYAPEYGWKLGKEVHSLWVQNAAEVGIPGVLLLFAFFLLCMVKLWPVARGRLRVLDPWQQDAARMVIASLFGFVIAAQFVTIKYLEIPYYVALLGVATLLLMPKEKPAWRPGWATPGWRSVRRRTPQPA